MRWVYTEFDSADSPEVMRRQTIFQAMQRWWAAFAAAADAVDRHFNAGEPFDLESLMNELAEVHPHLMWEFGPAVDKHGHRLSITPENRPELRPMLQVLLDFAPKLDRWEFYPYRLRDLAGPDHRVVDGRTKIAREGVTVSAEVGRGNRINLRYFLPPASMADDQQAQAFAFYTTERLVGEETLDRWIGAIEAFSENVERQPGSTRLPLDRLEPTVAAVIESICDQLPPAPRFAFEPAVESGKPVGWTIKFPQPGAQSDYPGWSDLLFASTRENQLFQACHAPAFYSVRFSRCGETFCYLKMDRRQRPELATVAERGKIEDRLTAELAAAQLGCTTGGGTGIMYSYIELALVDVRKSVPIIRSVLDREGLAQGSWLLFHDAVLKDEWIGGNDQTPRPPLASAEDSEHNS